MLLWVFYIPQTYFHVCHIWVYSILTRCKHRLDMLLYDTVCIGHAESMHNAHTTIGTLWQNETSVSTNSRCLDNADNNIYMSHLLTFSPWLWMRADVSWLGHSSATSCTIWHITTSITDHLNLDHTLEIWRRTMWLTISLTIIKVRYSQV